MSTQQVNKLLHIKNLRLYLRLGPGLTTTGEIQKIGVIRAVEDVNLEIRKGEIICLVGESGAGKTTLALSIGRLIPYPPAKILSGQIFFENQDLLRISNKKLNKIRQEQIIFILQNPLSGIISLDKVTKRITENIMHYRKLDKSTAKSIALRLMATIGIPTTAHEAWKLPHTFTLGQRQKIAIAIALSRPPKLLIADEPVSSLDTTTKAVVHTLIKQLKDKYSTGVLYITHDLGITAQLADRIAIMHAGEIVEENDVQSIFNSPAHPYTQDLLRSLPDKTLDRLHVIEGEPPNLLDPPSGCRYHPRCSKVMPICNKQVPPRIEIMPRHFIRCFLFSEDTNNDTSEN